MIDDLAADRKARGRCPAAGSARRRPGGTSRRPCACSVGGHAGAVVAHLDDQTPPPSRAQRDRRPGRRPAGTNFAALESRFSITWVSRSGSARSGGTRVGQVEHRPRRRARGTARRWSRTASRDQRAQVDVGRCATRRGPTSILAMSSTWLTSRLSRSLSETMMRRNSCALLGLHVGVVEHQLGEGADRGQRRAQLVGHRGHEVVLQVVEALQLLVGGAQLGGRRLQRARLLLERARVAAQLRRLVEDLDHVVDARAAPPARPRRP